jgi:hypothetical protein
MSIPLTRVYRGAEVESVHRGSVAVVDARKHKVLEPCRESKKELDIQTAPYLAIVERLREKHPHMVVFDGRAPFCDKKYCYAKEGVSVLYRDSNHLNSVGAEKLMRPLMQVLRALPQAQSNGAGR